MDKLICGSRGSELALWQTRKVISELAIFNSRAVEIKEIVTTGDRRQTESHKPSDDKKDWIYEIEQALLRKEIDFAVHSAKDVPIDIEPETIVIPVLQRASAIDSLILSKKLKSSGELGLEVLPRGGQVGTSSTRRASQLKSLRPDLEIVRIRGNVRTRISKIESEGLDAVILAKAGLERLGIDSDYDLKTEEFVPAVNQGILLVQFLKNRKDLEELFLNLVDSDTRVEFNFEREVVKELEANCSSALGVFAKSLNSENKIQYQIRVLDPKTNQKSDFSGELVVKNELNNKIFPKEIEKIKETALKFW